MLPRRLSWNFLGTPPPAFSNCRAFPHLAVFGLHVKLERLARVGIVVFIGGGPCPLWTPAEITANPCCPLSAVTYSGPR